MNSEYATTKIIYSLIHFFLKWSVNTQANPAAYKVTWLHNGMEVQIILSPIIIVTFTNINTIIIVVHYHSKVVQRPDKQMFISNQSLVLQKVFYNDTENPAEGIAENLNVLL